MIEKEIEEAKELSKLYSKNWSPRFVDAVFDIDKLDEIKKISIILRTLPKGTNLWEMTKAIDPSYPCISRLKTWNGCSELLGSICQVRDRSRNILGWENALQNRPATEAEIKTCLMARLFQLFLKRENGQLEKRDWSKEWEEHLSSISDPNYLLTYQKFYDMFHKEKEQ